MSYFLYPAPLTVGSEAGITGKEARHIAAARRLKSGEIFEVQDSRGARFEAVVIQADKTRVRFAVRANSKDRADNTPVSAPLTLFQALIKEKALDFIIQKTTELGVGEIVIFNADRTPRAYKPLEAEKKLLRWKKIAAEACKQSGRAVPPVIRFTPGFPHDDMARCGRLFIATENAPYFDAGVLQAPGGLVVGPEGGFSKKESDVLAALNNGTAMRLGPYTLRAETAAVAGIAMLSLICYTGRVEKTEG